jgi:ABC-2 type transport system ATP-binding protein
MMKPELAIRMEGLTRDFGQLRAVDNISLQVVRGAVFGFLGPNGSGKTTTIRLLLGILHPTAGRVEVLGRDVASEPDRVRERCGALLEHHGLYERLTAEDNLEFYGRVARMPARDRKARIRELLDHIGLWDRRGERVGDWSRGMKQKLAVARTMLHRPSMVFLDEPTAGLDPIASAALRDDLARLARMEGTTVFLTTHNLSEAERLCSQVAVISKGKLLATGHPDELRAQTGGIQVEIIGTGFGAEAVETVSALPEVSGVETRNERLVVRLHKSGRAAPVVRQLVNAGVEIEEVRKGTASLEEAFLTLVEEGNGR